MATACLDLPALPLQIVWRKEPAWRAHPVVVIDSDRPQGIVLWACEKARSKRILPGHRYAHALSLCGDLRARVVPAEQIEEAIVELRGQLATMTPRLEPGDDPGTFWLDGDGLGRIFTGREAWGRAIMQTITKLDYTGAVVVGYSRFATFAIARATRTGITVLRSDADERRACAAVPLARLDIDARLRDQLARLGVTSLGQMIRLPGAGILERFGSDAHRLYQLAAGERWDPLVPTPPPEAPDERVLLDDDESDVDRLVFVLKGAVDRLLDRLAAKGRALVALHVELVLRRNVGHTERRSDCIKPAAATLDSRALMRLVHLRFTSMPPAEPVNEARVWADDVAASKEQLALFATKPRRDLRAADEALARVRAELGDDSVVRAVLRDGHLPEATYGWERLVHVTRAQPSAPKAIQPLVRRIHARPQILPPQARQVRDDGWLLSSLEQGAVVRILGPYIISGGWWQHELHREYHYAETRRGDCLWVYYDRNRRRWFLHGEVV